MTVIEKPTFALLTKSYAGDFEMCRALCESVDRHMPDVTHYLVIDRIDRDLFAPLATDRRILVETERHLPEFRLVVLGGRRFWFTPYGPPVRGWIYQQIAKMAVTATLDEQAIVLVDSDVVFFRQLDPHRLIRDGRTRLYRAPGASNEGEHRRWHRVSSKLLGLPSCDYFGADYISNAVTWRPSVVRAMLARIRSATQLPWRMAVSWRLRFSEYILYGVFADHVDGRHQDALFHDQGELCHCSWHFDLETPGGREAFVSRMTPDQAAVLIQSNLNLKPEVRTALIDDITQWLDTKQTTYSSSTLSHKPSTNNPAGVP